MSLAPVPNPRPRRRPQIKTFREVKAEARPPFRVAGLIHSTLTGIVGEPYAGKSALSAHLIASGLRETPFLGVEWQPAPDHVVLVSTDSGSAREYAERLDLLGLEDDESRLSFVDEAPASPAEWAAIRDDLRLTPLSLVVIDNLTGFVPDLNSTRDAQEFFQAVEGQLCRQGVTVVLVAHKSEKSGPHGKARTPMGTTAISAKLRHVVYADPVKDGLRLTTRGNECEEPLTITLSREGHAAAFVVREVGPSAERLRSQATLDRNAEMAAWVVENCQGRNKTATASALAQRFGGRASGHSKSLQPARPLGCLLTFDPQGKTWARTGPTGHRTTGPL